MNEKKTLAVIGVGTAGLQSLCHFLTHLNSNQWQVVSIHSPDIKSIAVGESTNPPFLEALENGAQFNVLDDLSELDATMKFGARYKNWRQKDFTVPVFTGHAAIHINTSKLKKFVFSRLTKIWKSKFIVLEGRVESVQNNKDFVSVIVDGKDHRFDYVVDSRGFPKTFEDYKVIEDYPLNHALVHNVSEKGEWGFTTHEATPDGWMFGIPLTDRISYGYMFHDETTTVENAKINFSKQIGISVDKLDNVEYKFKTYYSEKILEGRIIKNGNAAAFIEPMFANSLWLYNNIDRMFMSYIHGTVQMDFVNHTFVEMVEDVEDLISYMYHGGSNYNTDFWKKVIPYAKEKLRLSRKFNIIKPILQRQYKDMQFDPTRNEMSWLFPERHLFRIDENMGYNYFSNNDNT